MRFEEASQKDLSGRWMPVFQADPKPANWAPPEGRGAASCVVSH
jgi:hypothetical protein